MHILKTLKDELYSSDWEISLNASDKLSEIYTPESIEILTDALQSSDNFIRNSGALGIRELKNQEAYKILLKRILELGPNEKIGTLVYSLEYADCKRNLDDLIELFLKGNYEVRMGLNEIFTEQTFELTNEELKNIQLKLNQEDLTINELGIRFVIL